MFSFQASLFFFGARGPEKKENKKQAKNKNSKKKPTTARKTSPSPPKTAKMAPWAPQRSDWSSTAVYATRFQPLQASTSSQIASSASSETKSTLPDSTIFQVW